MKMTKVELLKYLQTRALAEQKFYNDMESANFDEIDKAKSMNHLAKIMVVSGVVYMHK